MGGSFKVSDTIDQAAFLRNKDTGLPLTGLTDVKAKIVNPDGSVLAAALTADPVSELPGVYRFTLLPADRTQVGVYKWQLTSALGNFEQPVVGSFLNGILTAGGAVGSEAVTVFVRDSVTLLPITDASVSVYSPFGDGYLLIHLGKTNASGFVVLSGNAEPGLPLDVGTYYVRLVKALASFEAIYEMEVVEGGPNEFVFEGLSLVIPPPVNPELVRIYGNVRDLGLLLRDVDKAELSFQLARPPAKAGDVMIFKLPIRLNPSTGTSGDDGVYFNDDNGDFWIDVVRSILVRVKCQILGLQQDFTSPDQPMAKLIDLIPGAFS